MGGGPDMDLEAYFRFVLALVFVLALIGLLAWIARRYGFGARGGSKNRFGRRVDIVETRAIDGKRRLVLLRRDDVEHLVMIGANADLLIEQGIPASRTEVIESADTETSGPAPQKPARATGSNFGDELSRSTGRTGKRGAASK